MLSIFFVCIFLTVEILLNRYLVEWYLDNFFKNKKVSYTIFNVARSPNLALVKGTYCIVLTTVSDRMYYYQRRIQSFFGGLVFLV